MHYRYKVAVGSAALLAGAKLPAARFLARGLIEAEQGWRAQTGFSGGWSARWVQAVGAYHAAYHRDEARRLRTLAVPLTLMGAGGLFVMPRFTPGWWAGAGGFLAGIALQAVGNRLETDRIGDPMATWAGPLDDVAGAASRYARRLLRRGPSAMPRAEI